MLIYRLMHILFNFDCYIGEKESTFTQILWLNEHNQNAHRLCIMCGHMLAH